MKDTTATAITDTAAIIAENAQNNTADRDICPQAGACGGCVYQGTSYGDQLLEKEREVRSLFEDSGIKPRVFDPIRGCNDTGIYEYRNKMEYTFGDEVKDGPLTLGMHKRKQYMSVVTVDNCQLVPVDFNKILRYTLDFCTQKGYSKYHKKKHDGLLRNLVVRKGIRTEELLVNMVTSGQGTFHAEEWKDGLKALDLKSDLCGIMHTINDSPADAVNCDELRILEGRDHYFELINDLQFKVNEFSFFQTNVEAVERLYTEAVSLLPHIQGRKVFDLYCGTGTISQIMAPEAASVTGVDIVEDNIRAARENAALNGLENCSFICGDVFQVLNEISELPDVIVVDPPRAGMRTKTAEKVASYGVPYILYISCNPKTLVSDLKDLEQWGYEVDHVKPYDNFPMTKHVESVVLLTKVHN